MIFSLAVGFSFPQALAWRVDGSEANGLKANKIRKDFFTMHRQDGRANAKHLTFRKAKSAEGAWGKLPPTSSKCSGYARTFALLARLAKPPKEPNFATA